MKDFSSIQQTAAFPQHKSRRDIASPLWLAVSYSVFAVFFGTLLIAIDREQASWPDKDAHWRRVLQIAQGHLLSIPDPAGTGNYGGIFDGKFYAFNNTAINSPFVYFPSALSNVFFFGHQRIASLVTLLCCVAITATAIYLSNQWAWGFCGIALLPIYFESLCWPTADAVTNSFSLLFVAYVIHLWQKEKYPSGRQIVVLSLLAMGLGLCKITCVFLVFIVAILAIHFHSEWRYGWWISLIPIACAIGTNITWDKRSKGAG